MASKDDFEQYVQDRQDADLVNDTLDRRDVAQRIDRADISNRIGKILDKLRMKNLYDVQNRLLADKTGFDPKYIAGVMEDANRPDEMTATPPTEDWQDWKRRSDNAAIDTSRGSMLGALKQWYLQNTEPSKYDDSFSEGDATRMGLSSYPMLPLMGASGVLGNVVGPALSSATDSLLGGRGAGAFAGDMAANAAFLKAPGVVGKLRSKFAGGGIVKGALGRALQAAGDHLPMMHEAAPLGALSVVKQKGGNWLTGSVENALRGLKVPHGSEDMLPIESGVDGFGHHIDDAAAQRIKDSGSHYISPSTGELFGSVPPINTWIDRNLTNYVKNLMATPEDPVRALAEQGVLHYDPNDLYSSFHTNHRTISGNDVNGVGVADLARNWENISDGLVRPNTARDWRAHATAESLAGIPGIEKIPDDVMIHEFSNRSTASEKLGFDHLIDELSNSINPESGLPPYLQFPADRLSKVSVPQAVQRVHDINAWRAAQQAEANAAIANNAATHVVKEYPENNPKGLRWVELKAPEGMSKEDVLQKPGEDSAYDILQSALKYEGDQMGHCVGGYCDDVLSGSSRIFSLRDAKGQPHVTIEVNPSSPRDWAINQIKGKSNAAPIADYLPYVQDFVKTQGPWSSVGDLRNAGLQDTTRLFKPETIDAWPSRYMSDAEIMQFLTDKGKGLAHGGPVYPARKTGQNSRIPQGAI